MKQQCTNGYEEKLKCELREYIEIDYNCEHQHSTLRYLSPLEFRKNSLAHKKWQFDNLIIFSLSFFCSNLLDVSETSEPYYPVNNNRNNCLYVKYKELASKEKNVIFGGRLGEYKYFDMDKVIESALKLANSEL